MTTRAEKMDTDKVVLTAKRTECVDAENITTLVRKSVTSLYGRVDIVDIIEKASFALTLTDRKDLIVSHASFYNYPNVNDVDSSQWEDWMAKQYDLPGSVPLNTLYLHLFVSRDEYCLAAMGEILRIAFTALPFLQYVCLAAPSQTKLDIVYLHFFEPVPLKDSVKSLDHELRVATRHKFCPSLHIREARVEDNDDLLPIFKTCNQNLDKQYGDYFIAEMIECQDQDHRTIVAEVDGVAKGFVSISSEVDLELLNSCFDLAPFHDLQKPPPNDEVLLTDDKADGHPGSNVSLLSDQVLTAASQVVKEKSSFKQVTVDPKATSQASVLRNESQTSPLVTPVDSSTSEKPVQSSKSQLFQKQQSKASSVALVTEQKLIDSASMTSGTSLQEKSSVPLDAVSKQSVTAAEQSSQSRPLSHDHTRDKGPSNAVSIQLFCMEEKHELRSVDFLPAVFQLFPDKDLVVVTQPPSSPDNPLINHFTRVTPLSTASLSQELYVFHKCALLESFFVRPVLTSDMEAIIALVSGVEGGDNVVTDVKNYLLARRDPQSEGASPLQAVVATCMDQVIGVAVLRQEAAMDYLRAHYNIEDFIYYNYHAPEEHGHMHHFVLNPVFQTHCRHFLNEVLRVTQKTSIYYPLYPAGLQPEGRKPHSVISALPVMVQVQPRRQVQYNVASLGLNAPREEILEKQTPFALYHYNRKLAHEPKIQINARIVVVGASDTAISLLESLITTNPHIQFNNLTLVSPNGLPIPQKNMTHFLPNNFSYNWNDYQNMALQTWLNVVHGRVVHMDRSEKQLTVVAEDGRASYFSYEYLIFANGTQYQIVPDEEGQKPPHNVFTLNDVQDELSFGAWLEACATGKKQGRFVVYGCDLSAFTAVEGLMQCQVKGEQIVLVHPSPPRCFNNPAVLNRVIHELKEAGVTIHEGYKILRYSSIVEEGEGEGEGVEEGREQVRVLAGVTLTNPSLENGALTDIECSALLYLHEKGVDLDMFNAVNNAYLVFDRRLVVDRHFQTNDPYVFGAGPATKFSRKYYSEKWTHANFQSKEVGQKLASVLLPLLDASTYLPPQGTQDLIPVFHQPTTVGGVLPGGIHYLHVEKPNVGENLEEQMKKENYGQELVTGSQDAYFRLHINCYNCIQTITCLNKQPIDTDNIISVYGIHEKYLNNLVQRFDEKLIEDLYSYFREPWTAAIFHDRFKVFREEIREILQKPSATDGKSFQDVVTDQLPDDLLVSQTKRDAMKKTFKDLPVGASVEQHLLLFLNYNSYHLPMYAKPHLL